MRTPAPETVADARIAAAQFSCCGYFLANDTVEFGGFCANQTFVETTLAAATNRCVTPITAFTDFTLNNVFT